MYSPRWPEWLPLLKTSMFTISFSRLPVYTESFQKNDEYRERERFTHTRRTREQAAHQFTNFVHVESNSHSIWHFTLHLFTFL